MRVLFPIFAIKQLHRYCVELGLIQATRIDAVAVRIRSGNIKRFDAAGFAKQVFRLVGIEGISSQILLALQQLKS